MVSRDDLERWTSSDPGRGRCQVTTDSLRILVTGAQGFVGRYLVRALLDGDRRIAVLGIGRSSRQDALFTHAVTCRGRQVPAPLPAELREAATDSRYRYASADIERESELVKVLDEFRPHSIIHLATALRDEAPLRLLRSNVQGTINLLSAIGHCGLTGASALLGSSAAVYGPAGPDDLPLAESRPLCPAEIYGVSKLAAERAAQTIAELHGIKLITARLFNLVGPAQDERHVCARLVSQVVAPADGPMPPVLRVGRLDTTRDFVDVRDVASALVLLAARGVPGEVYNVASGTETSIRSLLDDCLALAGDRHRFDVQTVPGREGDVLRSLADISKLCALGFRPAYSIRDSLGSLFAYYQSLGANQESASNTAQTRDQRDRPMAVCEPANDDRFTSAGQQEASKSRRDECNTTGVAQ
jgi:nucleoside-diphosphate-sugar epimerase